jgi:DNA-binding CsgD family transcriptional regulator
VLLERDAELAEIDELMARTSAGAGAVLVIEGAAGLGKTRLLEAAVDAGRAQGMLVLEASATELEQDLGYGVARSLLEPAVIHASPARRRSLLAGAAALAAPVAVPGRGRGVAVEPAAVLHGLFWLVSNLADRDRLLLVVDDAHWADDASLRFLSYLGRRLGGLSALLLLAARPFEPGSRAGLVLGTSAGPARAVLNLAPLSEAAVRVVVTERFGSDAAPEFVAACYAATGGNPFLVGELLAALESDRVPATAKSAARVERIGPETVSRAVLARVSRLGAAARALTDALAVLGGRGELRYVASLAGIPVATAAMDADALAQIGVLRPARPLAFVHPLVNAALYGAIAPGRRALLHRAAARLIDADGAGPELAAIHLLNAEPAGEQWVVDVLSAAARKATASGAPAQAAHYLRRAMAEPPAVSARPGVLAQLGAAELLARDPAAADHLGQALAATAEPAAKGGIALLLGRSAVSTGRLADARDLLGPVIAELGETEAALCLRLEAYRWVAGAWDPRYAPELRGELRRLRGLGESGGAAGRSLLLLVAFRSAFEGGPHEEIVALIERALDDGRLIEAETAESIEITWAARALTFIDELDRGDRLVEEMVADARRRGSVMGYAAASAWRAAIALRRGLIGPAEADARTAVDLMTTHGLYFIAPHAYSFLGEALIELGALDEAAAVLEGAELGPMEGTRPETRFLLTRARVRLARGDRAGALADLLVPQALEHTSFPNPNVLAWRSFLALALPEGSRSEALALADLELELARRVGQPRAIGGALRARALLARGDEQISLLREAADASAAGPSRLEQARALTDLGAALRRASRRSEAVPLLRQGLDLAAQCGARVLADRAQAELLGAGARPRRRRTNGVEALTASERRVAELAASGMTNREIGQALFVTLGAVSLHLTHVYDKLGITGRAQLVGALGAAEHASGRAP